MTAVFGLIVAVLDSIGLAIIGVPLVVLWGLLSFITNFIPNIGFIIGVIPPALLGLLVGGWQMMVTVLVVYIVLNAVVQSLIQPMFTGDAVGLSTTITFVALLFWAWVLGPLGALLRSRRRCWSRPSWSTATRARSGWTTSSARWVPRNHDTAGTSPTIRRGSPIPRSSRSTPSTPPRATTAARSTPSRPDLGRSPTVVTPRPATSGAVNTAAGPVRLPARPRRSA